MSNRKDGNLVKKRFPLPREKKKTDHEKDMVDAQGDDVNEPLPQEGEESAGDAPWLFRNRVLNGRVLFGANRTDLRLSGKGVFWR